MRMIISPAKKMNIANDVFAWRDLPRFVGRTEALMKAVKRLSYDEAKELWRTSDALTELNFKRFRSMDVQGIAESLSPALFSYEGIQYQHIAPVVLEEKQLEYLQVRLRILSGFYGVLRPFDGVMPYRLEMQAKLVSGEFADLYQFWDADIADALREETSELLNLASVEYAKAVVPHARERNMNVTTCLFGRVQSGKLKQRATAAKAARGSMVRWCAENEIADVRDVRAFNVAGYRFRNDMSDEHTFVFEEPCKSPTI